RRCCSRWWTTRTRTAPGPGPPARRSSPSPRTRTTARASTPPGTPRATCGASAPTGGTPRSGRTRGALRPPAARPGTGGAGPGGAEPAAGRRGRGAAAGGAPSAPCARGRRTGRGPSPAVRRAASASCPGLCGHRAPAGDPTGRRGPGRDGAVDFRAGPPHRRDGSALHGPAQAAPPRTPRSRPMPPTATAPAPAGNRLARAATGLLAPAQAVAYIVAVTAAHSAGSAPQAVLWGLQAALFGAVVPAGFIAAG